jgi:hypothetical protein
MLGQKCLDSNDLESKQDVCLMMDVLKPSAEHNFCDECERAHKPAIVEDYSWHMGYVNKGDRLANTY